MVALSNADLDILFEPRGSTTKIANVNLQTSGVDVSNRYMDKGLGQGATAAVTNLQKAGVDLNQLFTALGDFLELLWSGLGAATVDMTFTVGSPDPAATLVINSDGSLSTTGTVTVGSLNDWLGVVSSSNGDAYECRYTSAVGDTLTGPSAYTQVSTNQSFQVVGGTFGTTRTNTFDLDIRHTASGDVETRAITLLTVNNIVNVPDILWAGLSNITYSRTASISSASLTINPDGTTTQVGTGAAAGNWLATTGGGDGGSFECKYQGLSGDSLTAGPNVFTSISSGQIFSMFNSGGGGSIKSATFTVVIRETGNASTEENRTVTLNATSSGIPQ